MSESKSVFKTVLAEVAEAALPWYLTGNGLGAGEEQELARRRAMPVTLTTPKGGTMAGTNLALAAQKAVAMAKKSPGTLEKIGAYYSAATGKPADLSKSGVTDAIIKRGPAPAAVLLRGAVAAGINPDNIFEGIILRDQADASTARIIDDLRTAYSAFTSAEDAKALIKGRGASSVAESLFRKEIILFARTKFGSPQAIREAHAKMRAFLDMDTESVEAEIALHLG